MIVYQDTDVKKKSAEAKPEESHVVKIKIKSKTTQL